jgi:hypothetical protein
MAMMGEWEAMKRYIVERARADAVAGENPTLRSLAKHVIQAVDGRSPVGADVDISRGLPAFLGPLSK